MPSTPPARRPKPQPLKPVRSGRFTAFVRTMWVLFGVSIVGLGLFVLAVSGNFLNLFGRMPNLKSLENLALLQSSGDLAGYLAFYQQAYK